jgi:hypothetical protein
MEMTDMPVVFEGTAKVTVKLNKWTIEVETPEIIYDAIKGGVETEKGKKKAIMTVELILKRTKGYPCNL